MGRRLGRREVRVPARGTTAFSPALVDVTTANHRETVTKVLGNDTYYWRVRAVGSTGTNSPWSAARSFDYDWSDVATPQSPGDGDTLTYPSPILLNWTSVPGAQKYEVKIATDSNLTSLVGGYPTDTGPTDTAASAYSPLKRLAPGTYYWNVTPIDAENHRGAASPTWSFTWNWDVSTTLSVTDLDPSDEVYDPQFSWTPIAGAAYYQVEANSDSSWASGSKACCSGYSVGTSLSPTKLLPAATYYWRVRPTTPARTRAPGRHTRTPARRRRTRSRSPTTSTRRRWAGRTRCRTSASRRLVGGPGRLVAGRRLHRHADHRLGSRSRRLDLRGQRNAVHGRPVRLDRDRADPVRQLHGVDLLDAARQQLEPREAVQRRAQPHRRAGGHHGPHRGRQLLRPGARRALERHQRATWSTATGRTSARATAATSPSRSRGYPLRQQLHAVVLARVPGLR